MSLPTPALDVRPEVKAFLDRQTGSISYVVRDPASTACTIVDPVLEFDPASGRLTHMGADMIVAFIRAEGFDLEWIIETHVHADRLSGARYIQNKLGGRIGIGDHIVTMQETLADIFDEGPDFKRDGSQFDRLFRDGETYAVGTMPCSAFHAPGHTPESMVHVMGDAVFAGDTLLMPDAGTARADLPGGDAGRLHDSIQRILSLPDEMRLFVGHDFGPDGRAPAWETTVGDERERNVHVADGTSREEFVRMRRERDAALAMPQLILPALQVNMRAGEIPVDQDGNMFLKLPVNAL